MIRYTLSFEQYYQHLISVSIKFRAQPQQKIWLPTWIPGSYLIREFAKHVESVSAVCIAASHQHSQSQNNNEDAVINTTHEQPISIKKISKNHWQLANEEDVDVVIRYQVYAYDLSVRGAYVDDERLYVNPAAVCMAVNGQENQAIELCLTVPENLSHFNLATGLKAQSVGQAEAQVATSRQLSVTHYQFNAKNYAQLIDCPIELAVQTTIDFDAERINHRVAISGKHHSNVERLSSDLEKICSTQIKLFGDAPFDNYLFMVMATATSYGGLEHQNSTSLITPRDDLPKFDEPEQPSTNYRRFLGLCSHEYFHSWLVKFIRPHNYVVPNLHQEDYTSLLWVFEGITSYYDDLILLRSGVIDEAAYLELLKEQISRYLANPGRHIQSVAESSFDAWIKYYRPDENSNNAGTSYYNKGALLALCLDLSLRQQGANLDQLLQALYYRAKTSQHVTESSIAEICQSLTGQSFQQFFDDYIDGTKELPLEHLLGQVGIELSYEQKKWPLGLKVQESPQGLLVQQVLRGSSAAKAGISAHDILVALNGLKATNNLLQQLSELSCVGEKAQTAQPDATDKACTKNIQCHLFRRDELKIIYIQSLSVNMPQAKLQITDRNLLKGWIGN